MAKKRPRRGGRGAVSEQKPESASKLEPAYWERRLFKNTFTYKGRRTEVRGWSVKIQLFGRRKTFTVNSSDRAKAALEAAQIYQTLVAHGWDAITGSRGMVAIPASATSKPLANLLELNPEYWRSRLIHRRYPETSVRQNGPQFSARIEHAGTSHYMPLGTANESEAAKQALRIYQAIATRGWTDACQKHSRELTLAMRWLDDPLAWTYTTIHTVTTFGLPPSSAAARDVAVAVIEPDPGIRFALARCVDSQNGFRCATVFATAAEAIREASRSRVDLILANQSLPDSPASGRVEHLLQASANQVTIFYSVFEDSDQLFKATPGGAVGYLLKRTPPQRILDPIAETPSPLTPEIIAVRIREYFQRLISAMPSGPSALDTAKLTPREHGLLALLAKGYLAKEIASTLGISIWTVHGHVKSIFEKLNVHTRTEAVVKFLQK